ncbi:unnamed protein product [Lathyrus sativus]|nr:unnamed protein product [Lathyrus sativus]
MAMEVTRILLNAQAVGASLRKQAKDNLKQFQEQNLPNVLSSLAGKLANDEKPSERRRLAELILKNALDSKEQHKKIEFVQRWLAMDPTFKAPVKAFLLRTLSSPSPDARSIASQVIAKIAGIELPHKQWPELIGFLLSDAHQLPAPTRPTTLEALGYICEEVSPDMVEQDHVIRYSLQLFKE